jgi:hypothetical protein
LATLLPVYVGEFDLAMEVYTLLSTFFFFIQWKESVNVYIETKYVQPLNSENEIDLNRRMKLF